MQWYRNNREAVKCKNEDATHLLLCGGILRIDEPDAFFRRVGADIENGTPNYLVEHRTPVFKLFQDFDFVSVQETGIDTQTFLTYMRHVQRMLREILPDVPAEQRDVIICSAPRKPVEKEVQISERTRVPFMGWTDPKHMIQRRTLTKSGYHAIYPNVLVDRETAIKIRFALVEACEQHFGKCVESCHVNETFVGHPDECVHDITYDNWDDIIDVSVYRANGLRMLGSAKATRCHTCGKRRERYQPCSDCNTTGYIHQGRPYSVLFVMNADGTIDEARTRHLQDNAYEAVRVTSIRCEDEDAVSVESCLPSWFTQHTELEAELDNVASMVCVGGKRKRTNIRVRQRDPSALSSATEWGVGGARETFRINNRSYEFDILDENDPRFLTFEHILQQMVSGEQRGAEPLQVTKMMISCDPEFKRIYAVANNKWCKNVNRAHSQNDVYYMYTKQFGVVQRCWSTGQGNGRQHGSCKSREACAFFNAHGFQLTKEKERELFPPVNMLDELQSLRVSTIPPQNVEEALKLSTCPGNQHPNVTPELAQLQIFFETMYLKYATPNMKSYFDSGSDDNNNDDDEEMIAIEYDNV